MCIAAWAWRAHPLYPLILFFNRDEYLNRPTEAVSWWEEPEILGGKDGIGGGTWLACSKDGRFAFLTNVLEVDQLPLAKTRGQLPVRFLQSENSPLEFAEEVAEEALQYKGFNLVLVDLHTETMVYVTNRPSGEAVTIKKVSPGLHVLSNASLDTLWPKTNAKLVRRETRQMPNWLGGKLDKCQTD
ncbi:hypothetical protein AMTR_s00044p00163450 [Amborella trichopoda]|uniref:Transport and Golgi organization protein 2 homolog n=1 Tax=Amborella trichopoda TaxID=13333 RepID=U5D442_AMBTC|nr:hypothetical protein AMTR_s00044p00163450 [Amborella trichopoda]